ncbi:MAG: hypothetical protein NTZ34_03300 [Chloroflexi bacterium]|nr:hypothetical protein [Chloroflexota bacterium]
MSKEKMSLRAPQGRGNLLPDAKPAEQDLPLLKDGQPWQAFAIVPEKEDPAGWQLPHHTKEVKRAAQGKVGYEHTVDWLLLEKSVLLLSCFGDEGRRVAADPELIIQAARHLAGHFRKGGRQIPNALCVLI